MTFLGATIDLSTASDEELQAQDLIKSGKIDQAIDIYKQLKPQSARVLRIIGVLYAEKKGDYDLGINYYKQALKIQEENGDNSSDTLTELGFAYQNLCQFDLALIYQLRALSLREEENPKRDPKLVATNYLGIANAYWGQQNLSEALNYAQRSLVLNESILSGNDPNIAISLAILANIYHHSGDNIRALELAKRALTLLECTVSPDSPLLAPLLNNIGTIQFGAGQFNDALVTFVQVLHICERTLPKQHPKRIKISSNIQRIMEMQQQNDINSFSHLWKFLTQFSLF